MIVVTGAAGFIASHLASALIKEGLTDILLVDRFPTDATSPKWQNIAPLVAYPQMDRDTFPDWFSENAAEVSFVFHIGARTDTAEFNFRVLDSLNLSYTKVLWEICTAKQIPFIYASSAATYGTGQNGFDDDTTKISDLKPLNAYGLSKQLLDVYALEQSQQPPYWVGLKFFNVYGPQEQHKGRMASVVYHAYQQIKTTGKLKLFQSHNPNYKDGEQLRDFIYVDDIVSICLFLYHHRIQSGIYNAGTGKARTFMDLGKAVFNAMQLEPTIEFIPTPIDIRDKYQYYTEATMAKLQAQGYDKPFIDLEDGVRKYIENLATKK